jgi:Rod binding domain-containing protein
MSATVALPPPGLTPLDLINNAQLPGKADTSTQAKAKTAARDFEAVFLNSMFQHMYTDIGGDGPFGGSGAAGVWRSMLTDQYARSFAKAGGIGIASQVYQSLLAHQEHHQ